MSKIIVSQSEQQEQSEKKPLSGIARAADLVVGDYVLGTLGTIGFHLGAIPGVRKAGAYIRDNVADGYVEAELAQLRRRVIADIREVTKAVGSPLTAAQVRAKAEKAGIRPEHLDDILKAVMAEFAEKSGSKPAFPMPAIPAAG